ncbi:XtmB Phage terminase large subunit [uncultured Caudovirales phage]|uniref:XtmB Phage terminase large subunit n=1 Tax=uncultured Caudovirales phage TaxID=2100421 RepID=A0A6J5N8W5_9CAUD|nr:XtmB Phage terminase large subunit [uncultured Caudovirales phage]
MELEIRTTSIFTRNHNAFNDSKIRFIINQGGTRSSKTYSIIQLLIYYCLTSKNKNVSIIRMSLPTIRGSVLKDFVEVMTDLKLYDESHHNKTDNVYRFITGSKISFISTDEPQKLRGKKHDVIFINEANEIPFEAFVQLNIRTLSKVIIDFNPSEESWINDLMIREVDKTILIKSTYKDNTFLNKSQVKEIEALINVDENYYRIYCLGEFPITNKRVYTHFNISDVKGNLVCYGIDFGYNHPTALVAMYEYDDEYYFDEIIYESFLTSNDLLKLMNEKQISKDVRIYCDYARPEIMQDLSRAKYRSYKANKEVADGIMTMKSKKINITPTSKNLLSEYKLYSWKENNSGISDEPIKLNDDGMDAMRYALHSFKKNAPVKMKVY